MNIAEKKEQPSFADSRNIEIIENAITQAVENDIKNLSIDIFSLFICKKSDVQHSAVDSFLEIFVKILSTEMKGGFFEDLELTKKQEEYLFEKLPLLIKLAVSTARSETLKSEENAFIVNRMKKTFKDAFLKIFSEVGKSVNRGACISGTIVGADSSKDMNVKIQCSKEFDVSVPSNVLVVNAPLTRIINFMIDKSMSEQAEAIPEQAEAIKIATPQKVSSTSGDIIVSATVVSARENYVKFYE